MHQHKTMTSKRTRSQTWQNEVFVQPLKAIQVHTEIVDTIEASLTKWWFE